MQQLVVDCYLSKSQISSIFTIIKINLLVRLQKDHWKWWLLINTQRDNKKANHKSESY